MEALELGARRMAALALSLGGRGKDQGAKESQGESANHSHRNLFAFHSAASIRPLW